MTAITYFYLKIYSDLFIFKKWPSSNLPLFLHALPPPLLAALRWTPVNNKNLHVNQNILAPAKHE